MPCIQHVNHMGRRAAPPLHDRPWAFGGGRATVPKAELVEIEGGTHGFRGRSRREAARRTIAFLDEEAAWA